MGQSAPFCIKSSMRKMLSFVRTQKYFILQMCALGFPCWLGKVCTICKIYCSNAFVCVCCLCSLHSARVDVIDV